MTVRSAGCDLLKSPDFDKGECSVDTLKRPAGRGTGRQNRFVRSSSLASRPRIHEATLLV
jgi:hypothetical protein